EATSAKTDAALGKTEAVLGALGGSVEEASARTEEALGALGGKVDTVSARTEEALSALGGKVDTVSAWTEEALGALGGKVDAASARTEEALGALGGKVDAASARTEGRLEEVAANVGDAGIKLDRTDAKIESVSKQGSQAEKKVSRKFDVLIRLLCANFALVTVGVTALFAMHCHPSVSVLQPAQGGTTSMGVGQGAAEARAKNDADAGDPSLRFPGLASDVSGDLGKTPPGEKWIPPEPPSGVKRGPCDDALREKAINGGCWQKVDGTPPCGQLWRHGDSCYRPILAEPKQPLGVEPRHFTPERQNR
ncbi:MAG TPA: hypothetical protein VK447_02545, partial [Myxococcaceae bacterium]|nr:hypothetical protein [Myxococcaceae bacterium]